MIERESVKSVGAYLESQAEAMRQALAALIEIPSYRTQAEEDAPYGKGPAAALQEGMRLAQEQGLRTRLVENVMLEADLGEGTEPGLGVLCHLDVVPEGTGWTVPPYALTRREGKLYGRGTIDDKGPAVAALFALGAIRALKIPLAAPVRLLLGSDEETALLILHAIGQSIKCRRCSSHRMAIIRSSILKRGCYGRAFAHLTGRKGNGAFSGCMRAKRRMPFLAGRRPVYPAFRLSRQGKLLRHCQKSSLSPFGRSRMGLFC